jgi:glycosyltransferase involved in cell wall biosynthesis
MFIGIDASRANKPEKTGVEWYAFHLIQALKKITADDGNSWVLYTREPLRDELSSLPENWYEVRANWAPRRMWTQARMSWEMWRRPCDVLFVPAHVLPPIRPDRSVVTVHDVGFKRMPHLYKQADKRYHEYTTRNIVKGSARIITVSEFSGKEIAELYKTDPSRIAITPLGIDHAAYRPIEDASAVRAVLARYRIPQPYFFFIGRLDKKKNVLSIVKAFDAFKIHRGLGDPASLVLAGKPGYMYEEIKKRIRSSPYRSQIMELGYVPEADVPALMNGAAAYVQVSWYEGFGIPPVQAMACACPVIAADNSALPEVLGRENALFVPPDGIDAMARAMERLIADHDLAESFKRKGTERAKSYTWEATAEKTLPVLTRWFL